MNQISAPRGTNDVFPPESAAWNRLESDCRDIAQRFGYGEIRTPMFEATELFVRGVGETTDIVEKEMYTFTDKGGRSMTLRPEWTAPVVRALLQHNLLAQGTQRLYYIGPFFRYERPPLSVNVYISFSTMSVVSPTPRTNSSVASNIGVRISP